MTFPENTVNRAPGTVHLVGAGPGDPGLLTVRALHLLQRADVVVYDRLISREIMDLVPAGTRTIFAGKRSGHHHMEQEEISALLVDLARRGFEVVRLKGGDPFLFARGGEEASELVINNIPFTVVPGITAASAVGATLGLPLTHRDFVSGVRFVTGHCRQNGELRLDWAALADAETTLVVYMGLANIGEICRELIAAGMPADIPACAVSNGTLTDQRQCKAPLAALPKLVEDLGLTAPVLIVIGRVTEMINTLNWNKLPIEDGAKTPIEAVSCDGLATG
ncbi:MAG: uroporphyrinogen-III C-methyltransferase [Hyphomicrobiales bacterium]|nr:uroporphyrinogen-III C-methyltransferase [Hyphomicrobiales bacterium]